MVRKLEGTMVRREIVIPREDWELLKEYFHSQGYIPGNKISEIVIKFAKDLRKKLNKQKKEASE